MRTPEDPLFMCHYGSECDVTRENRNKCRACRLRRCQEAGMFFGAGIKSTLFIILKCFEFSGIIYCSPFRF